MILDTSGVIRILILVVLLILSAFFSSAETALTTVNRVKIRTLAEAKKKRAVILQKVLDRHSKMLSAILIGNNIVNIAASSLTTTLTIDLIGNAYIGAATGILTFLVLLFGEIIPKNWATMNAERISLAYARIIYGFMMLLTPVIFLVDRVATGLLHILGFDRHKRAAMTETELRTYVDVSHEDGVIETEEREMIYNVFDFSDAVARDIMIPRIDMVTISADARYHDLFATFREYMYTRVPVYDKDKDHIIGMVNIKDFLLVENRRSFRVRNIIRPVYYTYELKKTSDLLPEMRKRALNVSIILDEYGTSVGMITMEDLLEEIVGEIRDEYDEDETEQIRTISDREYLVEGNMKLADLNDALGCSLDSEDYDSIGGLVMELLDKLPEKGESATTATGVVLTVEDTDEKRILKVRILFPDNTENNSGEDRFAETDASETDES